MKICIDIQSAVAQRAGVGRYTRSLVEHMPAALEPEDSLSVFYFDFQKQGQGLQHERVSEKAVRWVPGRVVQGAWKYLHFPPFNWLAGRADVYHFPNFVRPPMLGGKSVVTIHDVSFLRFPETTEKGNLAYLKAKIHHTCRQADAIITDSEFSAREIESLLGVPTDKIHPVHLGLSLGVFSPSPASKSDTLIKLGLEKPYLLCVGTLEPRKNYPFLVDVFERLKEYDGDLVIAGMRGWKYGPILERIQNSPCADRIRYLEYVEDDQLSALYSGADLFVFPSLYEGFGFPPLEAMLCGTAVVSSAAASLPEVLGDAACLVEGYEAENWVEAIRELLGSESKRKQLREAGEAQTKIFDWNRTARETLDVYRKVLS
jgi:glycosyltransferase involved in cell wall biosynthesis